MLRPRVVARAVRRFPAICRSMTSTAPSTLHLDIERHQLANGLRVVLHRDAALPLVAVNLWYHVASKNERPGHTAFAHLFEHILFPASQPQPTHSDFPQGRSYGGVT